MSALASDHLFASDLTRPTCPAALYRSKLQSLAKVLNASTSQVSALVRRRPHLLACSAETLASKFSSLEKVLHCSHAEVRGGGCVCNGGQVNGKGHSAA